MGDLKNPLGVHALVGVGDTSPSSLELAIEQTKAAGYDLLELSLHDSVDLAFDADVSSADPAVVARLELGSGQIDFDSFFDALADVGDAGPITSESFSSAVVMPGLSADLAIWRNLWDDQVDLAEHAHTFMSDQLGRAAAR